MTTAAKANATATAVDSATASAAAFTTTKLRLMCSYGGRIVPRPGGGGAKSLYYANGETRIVSASSSAAAGLTLVSLTNHLAVTLNVGYPFTIKYQLPHHDLDSLVSVATDEDLQIMVDEHLRLSSSTSSSPSSSRIRLFLFPAKTRPDPNLRKTAETDWLGIAETELTRSPAVLQHPKTETWFVDALRSARIMQSEGNNNGNGGICCQESIVLETSSSFGSTSSSTSLSNSPPVRSHGGDDNNINNWHLLDTQVKFASPESVSSDNSMVNPISHVQTGSSREQSTYLPVTDNNPSSNPFEDETILFNPSFAPQMRKPVLVSGYPPSALTNQPGEQIQVVYPGAHYVTQNPPGVSPVTSYHPMYQAVTQQPTQVHFQPPQPYTIYYIPVGQSHQPYNMGMQPGLMGTSGISTSQPPVNPGVSLSTPSGDLREPRAGPTMPELASQVYPTSPAADPRVHVPYEAETIAVGHRENAPNYSNEPLDDAARAQIYKSQPPPPMLPSQYQ